MTAVVQRAAARVAIIATVGLCLLEAACGSSARSHVAELRSSTSESRSSGAPPGSPKALTGQALAFSRCIRVHGVPSWPDRDSKGVLPKSQVEVAAGGARYAAREPDVPAPAPVRRPRG